MLVYCIVVLNTKLMKNIKNCFNQLCSILASGNEIDELFNICDILLINNHCKDLEQALNFATTDNAKKYIEFLIEIKKGTEGFKPKFCSWALSIEYLKTLNLIAIRHPRRLALYMLRVLSNKEIFYVLESISENQLDLLYNLIELESRYYPEDRGIINQLITQILTIKMDYRSAFLLAKIIGLGMCDLSIDGKMGVKILGLLTEYHANDIKRVNSLLKCKDSLLKVQDFLSDFKSSDMMLKRTKNGNWHYIDNFIPIDNGLLLHTNLWGNREIYLDGLANIGWPSLSNSANIDNLDYIEKTIYIHTTTETLDDLKIVIDQIDPKIDVILDTRILQTDELALTMRGWTFIDIFVQCALFNLTYVCLVPEWYHGKGLDKLIKNCPIGGISCVPVIRVSENGFYEFHKKNKDNSNLLNLNNKQLSKLAFSRGISHIYSKLYIENLTPAFTSISLPNDDGIILYSWSQCSVVIKPDYDFIKLMFESVMPIYSVALSDNLMQFVDHLGFHKLIKKDLVYRPDTSEKYVLIEPTRDSGYSPFADKRLTSFKYRYSVYPDCPYTILFQ